MSSNLPKTAQESVAPDPLAVAVQDAQSQWARLGMRIRSVTPAGLARGLLVASILFLMGWLLWNARVALLPFILGALLAYALLPVVNATDKFMPRPFGSILVVIATLALMILLLAETLPTLAVQLGQLTLTLPTGERVRAWVTNLLAYGRTLPLPVQTVIRTAVEQEYARFEANLPTLVETLIASTLNSALRIGSAVAFVLGLLVSFPWVMGVINDQPTGVQTARQMLPPAMREDVWAVVRIIDRALRTFINGQVLLGFATGLFMFVGMWILTRLGSAGDTYPSLLGTFAGLSQLVPAFGPYLGAVGVFLLGLLISWQRAFLLLGLYLLSLFLVNQLLGDRLTRRIIPVHPVLVAVIVVAISQLGLGWVLFAAPIIAILRDTVLYFYGRLGEPPRPAGLLPSPPAPAATSAAQQSRPAAAPLTPPPTRRAVVSGARYPPRPIPPAGTDGKP